MRNTLFTLALLASSTSLAACGGGSEPAKEPSLSNGVTSTQGPAAPGDPAAAMPGSEGTKPTSGAPASPMEGKCKSAEPQPSAKDFDSCLTSCKGLDDQAPPGSKCIPAKTSCISQCNTKYKKP